MQTRPPPAPLVRYGRHPDQVANLHLPPGTPPFPSVVLVHGGSWRDRWDRTLMTALARDLARRGLLAWNVEYRRVGRKSGVWPAPLEDVIAALEALRGIPEADVTRVALVGHSAGGHLALCAARRLSPPPTMVVALAAYTSLERAWLLDPDAVDGLLGGNPEERAALRRRASPEALLPLGAPQLLVHGEADEVVPVIESELYAAAARTAGDSVELLVMPSTDHFDVIDPEHEAWRRVAAELCRRLLSHSASAAR